MNQSAASRLSVIAATNNAHKLSEMTALLRAENSGITLLSLRDAGVSVTVEENGSTFLENALIKAKAVAKLTGKPALGDDSGLSVDALGGAPGVRSARYASDNGENASDAKNVEKLLAALKNIPDSDRTARFVSAVALVFPDGRTFTAVGVCEGFITRAPRGAGGFGYDPVFFYPPLAKTCGEMTPDEKNAVSHRSRALAALCKKIKDNL